jgi:hypothetical protein
MPTDHGGYGPPEPPKAGARTESGVRLVPAFAVLAFVGGIAAFGIYVSQRPSHTSTASTGNGSTSKTIVALSPVEKAAQNVTLGRVAVSRIAERMAVLADAPRTRTARRGTRRSSSEPESQSVRRLIKRRTEARLRDIEKDTKASNTPDGGDASKSSGQPRGIKTID